MPKMRDFLYKVINDSSEITDKSFLLLEDASIGQLGLVVARKFAHGSLFAKNVRLYLCMSCVFNQHLLT